MSKSSLSLAQERLTRGCQVLEILEEQLGSLYKLEFLQVTPALLKLEVWIQFKNNDDYSGYMFQYNLRNKKTQVCVMTSRWVNKNRGAGQKFENYGSAIEYLKQELENK